MASESCLRTSQIRATVGPGLFAESLGDETCLDMPRFAKLACTDRTSGCSIAELLFAGSLGTLAGHYLADRVVGSAAWS